MLCVSSGLVQALDFLWWSVRQLVGLVSHGIGLLSSVLAAVLFVLPSLTEGLSRWCALAPIVAYVLIALLWREYSRQGDACLTATLTRQVRTSAGGRVSEVTAIEIKNCGSVTFDQVEWTFPAEAAGWSFIGDIDPPWRSVAPGETIALPVSLSMGREGAISFPVEGTFDGRTYSRRLTVSAYG
jgi:hypothetical protein